MSLSALCFQPIRRSRKAVARTFSGLPEQKYNRSAMENRRQLQCKSLQKREKRRWRKNNGKQWKKQCEEQWKQWEIRA